MTIEEKYGKIHIWFYELINNDLYNKLTLGDTRMKSLGIVRKVDELGRIVLPIETRKRLGLAPKDPVEIFVEKDRVILKKYEPTCIFCGESNNISIYKEKRVCKSCLEDLKKGEF